MNTAIVQITVKRTEDALELPAQHKSGLLKEMVIIEDNPHHVLFKIDLENGSHTVFMIPAKTLFDLAKIAAMRIHEFSK